MSSLKRRESKSTYFPFQFFLLVVGCKYTPNKVDTTSYRCSTAAPSWPPARVQQSITAHPVRLLPCRQIATMCHTQSWAPDIRNELHHLLLMDDPRSRTGCGPDILKTVHNVKFALYFSRKFYDLINCSRVDHIQYDNDCSH